MNAKADRSGGAVAIRGYLVQTLVALLDIAQSNPPFIEITLEPTHANDQFDFVWSNANGAFATQVKSTINEFQKSDVERWAKKLEVERKNEQCSLILVGNYRTNLEDIDRVGAVSIQKKNLDLNGLRAQAAHQIAGFLSSVNLDEGTAAQREQVVHYLVGQLLNYSTTREPIARDTFINLLTGWVKEASKPAFWEDIHHIDKYAPAPGQLIGREAETKLLNDAWDQAVRGDKDRANVITFVALGGEGKTSLVARWAVDLQIAGWPGCDAVFAWSFYSQGATEQSAASSDLFLSQTLIFFGDTETAASNLGAYEKARRLAQLIGKQRALLILDGVEPLQYAPTSPMPGELKDQGLAALLKGLAANNDGLCVVTTRYSVPDLKAYRQTKAPEHTLLRLSTSAGVALLKSLGVKGNQAEYEKLVDDIKGHALTLTLLGTYLRDAHAGDIRKRDLVKLEEANEEQGGHAFRAMDAYVTWFETGGKNEDENYKGRRAIAILRLMGLFDRPASAACIAALLKTPAIPQLTESLVSLSEAKHNLVLVRLERSKLLTVSNDAANKLDSLDAHPFVREYFARQLKAHNPLALRIGHGRLFEHLRRSTKEGDLPTINDLRPLYQAVAHGCLADMQQPSFDVYKKRIARIGGKTEHYSTALLGAYGEDLGAITCFFETPWCKVSPALASDAENWLLHQAAFRLRALGRLSEAVEPMRSAADNAVIDSAWGNAAVCSNNLSELQLTLGSVDAATMEAKQSIGYADRSAGRALRFVARVSHAVALAQAGYQSEAHAVMLEAEALQALYAPTFPLLQSVASFRYCDLLLAPAETSGWRTLLRLGNDANHAQLLLAVHSRATQTLQWAKAARMDVLSEALDSLTLCRIRLATLILLDNIPVPTSPELVSKQHDLQTKLSSVVDALRSAGSREFIVHGLFAQTWLRALSGPRTGPDSAQTDLDEAWEISERGPMPLFLADIHLHRARLFGPPRLKTEGETYPWESPHKDLAEARRLIEKHGYWRRKEELEDAEAAAKDWPT